MVRRNPRAGSKNGIAAAGPVCTALMPMRGAAHSVGVGPRRRRMANALTVALSMQHGWNNANKRVLAENLVKGPKARLLRASLKSTTIVHVAVTGTRGSPGV